MKLRHHLTYNVFGLNPETIDAMIETITLYTEGKMQLNSRIEYNSSVTVADLLEDMKLPTDKTELKELI